MQSLTDCDVLLEDKSVFRKQWPYGNVKRVLRVMMFKKISGIKCYGKPVVYTRPISKLILLVSGAK